MSAETDGCGRPGEKGRGYHHGRLRQALLAAARALISERGPAGFTLAEAAKRVGVTGAAPYRHFADRNALVTALAQQGFEHFNEELGRAWDNGLPDPITALRRRGAAYLAFAKTEPGLYKAMFGDAGFLCTADGRRSGAKSLRRTCPYHGRGAAPFLCARNQGQNARHADLGHDPWRRRTHARRPVSAISEVEAAGLLETGVAALIETAVREALGVKG